MNTYPFLIRDGPNSRVRKVEITAPNYSRALDKVLSRYPNKFIQTKFARRMDLISAKVKAAQQSRLNNKKVYVVVDDEGECEISNSPLTGSLHCFLNGSEIALESKLEEPTTKPSGTKLAKNQEPKTNKTMTKVATATPAKKGIEKKVTAPVKKTAPTPAAKKPQPSNVKRDGIGKATTVTFTAAEWKELESYCDKHSTTIRELATRGIAKLVGIKSN